MKTQQQLELFYDFCGTFEKQLSKDYKKHIKGEITYPQFCIAMYGNIMEEANEVLNIKTKSNGKNKSKSKVR